MLSRKPRGKLTQLGTPENITDYGVHGFNQKNVLQYRQPRLYWLINLIGIILASIFSKSLCKWLVWQPHRRLRGNR